MAYFKTATLDVIDSIYDTTQDLSHWQTVADKVEHYLSGLSTSVTLLDTGHSNISRQFANPFGQAETDNYFEKNAADDAWLHFVMRCEAGRVYQSSDQLTQEEQNRSQSIIFFREHFGIEDVHNLGGVWERTDTLLAGINVVRERRFKELEMEFLSFLLPHCKRAFTVQHMLSEAYGLGKFALNTLDRIALGTILFQGKDKAPYLNERAEQYVKDKELRIVGNGIKLKDYSQQQKLDNALHLALNIAMRSDDHKDLSGESQIINVARDSGLRPLNLLILPFRGLSNFSQLNGGIVEDNNGAIVFILNEQRQHDYKREDLANGFDLSDREAEILQHLLIGKKPKEIATMLDLSVDAIRYHQKRLYKKTGTKRHIDLVSLVERTLGRVVGN